jgi:hypothetical protein
MVSDLRFSFYRPAWTGHGSDPVYAARSCDSPILDNESLIGFKAMVCWRVYTRIRPQYNGKIVLDVDAIGVRPSLFSGVESLAGGRWWLLGLLDVDRCDHAIS